MLDARKEGLAYTCIIYIQKYESSIRMKFQWDAFGKNSFHELIQGFFFLLSLSRCFSRVHLSLID